MNICFYFQSSKCVKERRALLENFLSLSLAIVISNDCIAKEQWDQQRLVHVIPFLKFVLHLSYVCPTFVTLFICTSILIIIVIIIINSHLIIYYRY